MILVTGGTGLVGAHILYDLCRTQDRVRVIKRPSSELSYLKHLFHFYQPEHAEQLLGKIEWVDADLLDVDALIEATRGVSEVYHAAAFVSFQKKDRDLILKVNIEGTANLMTACQENGVRKLGHVSSIATLGPVPKGKVADESCLWEVAKDNSTYSISKYGAEREVWRASEEGLSVVIVNPGIIFGPGDWNKGSISMFKTGHDGLKYYTRGSSGFVDVRDISRCLIELVNSEINKERYVMVGESLGYKQVFEEICTAFGKRPPYKEASRFSAGLAWRLAKVASWFSTRTPLLTKETVRSAMSSRNFSSQKLKDTIQFEFTPISKSITDTSDFIKKYYLD